MLASFSRQGCRLKAEEQDPESPSIGPGSQVDQFKVIRLLGRGGMAEVYLARDTRLGRKVALKVVRPESLGSPDAVERFLFEARATARFNHPNIVAVHAAGECDGVPYVALEYVDGETLRQRMEVERPSPRDSMRIVLAIAEALAEAHANGILHRDLKPENVLLGRDGRVRVVDFGLAKTVAPGGLAEPEDVPDPGGDTEASLGETRDSFETHDGTIRGTPSYMAPEQWTDAPTSGATDVWALGAVLYELLTGRPPFRAASALKLAVKVCGPEPAPALQPAPELPQELCELVGSCLDKDPECRPASAQAAEALRDMVAIRHARLGSEESPFRGLRPFGERHAEYFYGRTAEVAAFVERLREEPVLPVLGPSGAGKSSFVQAGVIPRLREQGRWIVLALRPGRRPFRTVAARFLSRERATSERTMPSGPIEEATVGRDRDDHAERVLADSLRAAPLQLNLLLSSLAEHEQARVLLFVDQLEELYTLVSEEEERGAFMEAICAAADDPAGPVRVVFTLRDDFLGRLAAGPAARDALSHVTVLRSPGPEALQEIVLRPVEDVGYAYDDRALVKEMVSAVRDEPACLPLLQFTTRQLWDRRDRSRRLLCRSVYEAMGGVEGALVNHADGVLEGMSQAQVRLARQLLLGLVTPEGTRKVVSRRQALESLGGGGAAVLDRLVGARLVSVRKSAGEDEDAELELVHESLVTRWRRLARWLEEAREEMAFLAEVRQAAELWRRRGRRENEVWTDEALTEARRNLERMSALPPEAVNEFLDAGRRRAARLNRRRAMRRAVAMAVLAAVAVGASVGAVAFREQRQDALRQREDARLAFAAAQQDGAQSALGRGDLLEARARLRSALQVRDSPLARTLWWQLSQEPLLWRRDLGATAYSAVFSPEGERLAVGCQDRSVYIIDVETRRVRVLRGHDDQVVAVAFAPDGKRLASSTWTGTVTLWSLEEDTVRNLKGPGSRVSGLGWSPDGTRLAAGGDDRLVRVWDLGSGAPPTVLAGHDDRVTALGWSPDGRRLASTGGDGALVLWDPVKGLVARRIQAHPRSIAASGLAWSPDGSRLATVGHDQSGRIWDATTGEELLVLLGHRSPLVMGVAWSPDGGRIVTAGGEHIELWDAATGEALSTLEGHQGTIYSVQFSADGSKLASASSDSTVRLWAPGAVHGRRAHGGHESYVSGLSVSPDGRRLASADSDGALRVWSAETGRVSEVMRDPSGELRAVAWSPDGRVLAAGGPEGVVRLWRLDGSGGQVTLGGHKGGIIALAWSPEGDRLATAGLDKAIRLWDVGGWTMTAALRGHELGVWSVSFAPDGGRLASGSYDGTVRIWDLATRSEQHVLRGHGGLVWGVAWSPDGRLVASASVDHTVRLWDAATGEGRVLSTLPGRAYSVAFAPSGDRVAVVGSEGIGRIFDLDGVERLTLVGHRSEVNDLAFAPSGEWLATTGDDTTVRLWDAATGRPVWAARGITASPPSLFSHLGWVEMDTGEPPTLPLGSSEWERAVRERARLSDEDEGGQVSCIGTWAGVLEVWDRRASGPLAAEALEELASVVALPSGCATVSASGLRLHGKSGPSRQLVGRAGPIAWDGERLLAASDRQVLAFGPEGEPRGATEVGAGLTALGTVSGRLVLGFAEGSLEVVPSGPGRGPLPLAFDDTPSSAVVQIVEGPMGTLVAGFANGELGIWSGAGGAKLYGDRLHGPVVHLLRGPGRLYAATELGDHRALDLEAFHQDWCPLLRAVWDEVPVVWQAGAPVVAEPPADHPCLVGEGEALTGPASASPAGRR